jgi:L-fucose mutarotase
MQVVDAPDDVPSVQSQVHTELEHAEGKAVGVGSIERMAFYERARTAYCVIATGERRFYGCFILKKGVLPP